MKNRRLWLALGQTGILVLTLYAAFWLAELWLYAAILLAELFSRHPLAAGGIVLLLLLLIVGCIRGAGSSRPGISIASRAGLLILSAIALVASVEFVYGGAVVIGVGEHLTLESYLPLGGGVLLISLAAAGIRRAFEWRVSYFIVLFAAAAAVAILASGSGIGILFS